MNILIFNNSDELISSEIKFESLSFETTNPGGFSVAKFDVKRKVTSFWQDIQPFNRVKIVDKEEVVWEGYMDTTDRTTKPDNIAVQCLGWSARLNQLGTETEITAGGGGYLMSTFITGVILADGDIEITEGNVETGDYSYPSGTRFEFSPYTPYFDCLEQLNAANNYDWGVWEDRKIDFTAKTPTDIDWLVYIKDCSDVKISPNPANLCNYVIVSYTQDSVHQQTTTRQDTPSQDLYGVVKKMISVPGRITTAGAQQVGDTYLADCSTLRVTAEFTCKRIFNSYGQEVPVDFVRAGDNVRLVDWLPTEERLRLGVTDISTFQIKSTEYNDNDASLRITPTEFVSQIEIEMARLQAVSY